MKQLLVGIVVLTSFLQADDTLFRGGEHDVILDSTLIKIVDGNDMGINGQRINMMIKVRKSVKEMQYGVPAPEGGFVGNYEYNNKKYSAHELMLLEAEAMAIGDLQAIHDLKPCLQTVKKQFMAAVKPFMASAHGAKGQMLLLIEESCKKRKRSDSILLRWGAAKESEEAKQFDRDIVDFKTFDTFCTDLIHFIEDVIRSCPKALAQFKQLVAQGAHKPHN